jgi:hypothetical protein
MTPPGDVLYLDKNLKKGERKKKIKWLSARMREIWTFRRPRGSVDDARLGGVKGVLWGYIPARGSFKTGPRA